MNALRPPRDGPPAAQMRAALARRVFGRIYQLLQWIGCCQQRSAALADHSQPDVSAIIRGRKVMAFDVIERLMWNLGIPLVGTARPKATSRGGAP